MKFRYDESFLFPQGQEDFGRGLMFPQGNLSGFGRVSDDQIPMVQTRLGIQPLYMNSDQIAGLSAQYPDLPVDSNGDLLRSTFLKFYISKQFPNPTTDYDKKARAEYEGIIVDLLAYEASPKAAMAAAAAAAPLRDALSQVEQYALAVNGANYDVRSLAQSLRQQGDSVGARALENTGAEFVAKANQALADAKAQAAAGNLAAVQQLAQVAAALMADIRRAVQVADGQVAATAAEAERSKQAAAAVASADAAEIARLNKAAAEAAAAQQAAAQQAAAQQAAAAIQTASEAAAAARKTVSFSLDADAEGTMFLIGKRADGTTYVVSTGAGNIDEYLKRNTNQTRFDLAQTAAYVRAEKADAAVAAAAASTHKAGVDTSTATVQHIDTASGTTSTVNAATGAVTVTTPSGATVTGAGTVQAGGVITTVDTKTGTVTTQNTNTGVTTQTNAATGQTQTAVQITGTAATGGTFMLPGGETVTTTKPITATGLSSGHIALAALLGVLLLRGAVR
jgi:hypothetical protein